MFVGRLRRDGRRRVPLAPLSKRPRRRPSCESRFFFKNVYETFTFSFRPDQHSLKRGLAELKMVNRADAPSCASFAQRPCFCQVFFQISKKMSSKIKGPSMRRLSLRLSLRRRGNKTVNSRKVGELGGRQTVLAQLSRARGPRVRARRRDSDSRI